jgi:electron transfer flavoprotein beta subunit
MKIVVALKQVPARDAALKVDASARWVREDELTFETNEPDAYALEEALQLKEQHGGEVVVISVGPSRAAQSIRGALAKGADRAIHVEEDDLNSWDPLGIAALMARALEPEKPDLLLAGLQSDDLGYGQTGVVLAELMGLPHATLIMSVEKLDGSVRVKRELEEGWFEHIEVPLPALLTIQSGISKLRYATLMGIKRAKTREIRRTTAAELGLSPSSSIEMLRVSLPHHTKQTEMLQGTPKEAAARLVERLKFNARVI